MMYWNRMHRTPVPEPIPVWVWCAGVAVVQVIVGCILLLLAINPGRLSFLLASLGALTLFDLCFPDSRAHPIYSLPIIYVPYILVSLFIGVRAILT
jgi:hypothetical protein